MVWLLPIFAYALQLSIYDTCKCIGAVNNIKEKKNDKETKQTKFKNPRHVKGIDILKIGIATLVDNMERVKSNMISYGIID